MSERTVNVKRGASTLKEIAEEVGVSIAAVSKVLNDRGGSNVRVSQEKAELILAVAKKRNYVPNIIARSLRTNRSHNIGLVYENFGGLGAGPQFFIQMLDGVANEAFANHFRLTILPEVDHEKPLSQLADGRLDGLIWCKMGEDPIVTESLRESNIPIVALHATPDGDHSGLVFIHCDNVAGSHLVVRHLTELGHSRILFVMEHEETLVPDARTRLAGFLAAMSSEGLMTGPDDIVVWSRNTPEFMEWWAGEPDHTAVYAWNEGIAASILRNCSELGVKVPDELSVVGFDSTPYCETTYPRLTAVGQPIREMGSHAVKALMELIEGKVPVRHDHVFGCTLDVRQSTGLAPTRGKATSSLKRTLL